MVLSFNEFPCFGIIKDGTARKAFRFEDMTGTDNAVPCISESFEALIGTADFAVHAVDEHIAYIYALIFPIVIRHAEIVHAAVRRFPCSIEMIVITVQLHYIPHMRDI